MSRYKSRSRHHRNPISPCLILGLTMICATAQAGGRPDYGSRAWFGHIGGGLNVTQGDFGDVADDGFAIRGGATYWPSDWRVGLQLEAAYADYDISSSAIRSINDAIDQIDPELGSVSGGEVDDWSFSVSAILSLGGSTSVGPYLMAGIGFDNVEASLTDQGLVYYPPQCDPWWYWCTPGGVGPGTFVVASESSTEFSWNVGAGWAFPVGGRSLLFVEARYKSIETDPETSRLVPLTVGFRW